MQRYENIKSAHQDSLQRSSSCFHLKRQKFAAEADGYVMNRELGKDIHPGYTSNDIVKRPHTTSLKSTITLIDDNKHATVEMNSLPYGVSTEKQIVSFNSLLPHNMVIYMSR